MLLEVLSDFQISIPELGKVESTTHPVVLLTSNNTRELSDALKRRWMTEDKATLHELADEYGISAERVRQVESNAISKLKGLMASA